MFYNKSQFKKVVEMDIDHLVPLGNCPLKFFRGQRREDYIELIRQGKSLKSLIVRPLENGKYEVICGHYRLAAAKEMKLKTLPVTIMRELENDEVQEYISAEGAIGICLRYGIDIGDPDFTKSDEYKRYADKLFCERDGVALTLGEYIERFLLTEYERYDDFYESIYSMGNPYELNEQECEYGAVAKEIIQIMSRKTSGENGIIYLDEYGTEDIAHTLIRHTAWLKDHMSIDLERYDYGEARNRHERAKILYFFYMTTTRDFPKISVWDLLKKPSMENIVMPVPFQETYNGYVIQYMLKELRKALPLPVIKQIEGTVFSISMSWDEYLTSLYHRETQGAIRNQTKRAEFDNYISEKIKSINETPAWYADEKENYDLSPIALLYLRLIQHQYLGQVLDVMRINAIQIDSDYSVPFEQIGKLREMAYQRVTIKDVESYINDNAAEIATYIYGSAFTRNNVRDIRRKGEKVRIIIQFCLRARPFDIVERNVESALFVVSCLQAIMLDSQNETFDYTFSGYQRHKKHKSKVQGALKGDKHPMDALKIYWVRKTIDHWHANIGMYEVRCSFRKLEEVSDQKRIEILSCSSLSVMKKLHKFYMERLLREMESATNSDI